MKIPTFLEFKNAIAWLTNAGTMGGRKPRSRGLWSTLVWPLAMISAILVIVIASSIYLIAASETPHEMVNRTLRIESQMFSLLATVTEGESGQRSYLLTGDPAYLDAYRIATDALDSKFVELRAEMVDKPQRKALAEIEPLLKRRFAEMAETLRLYDAGDVATAMARVRGGAGRDLMKRIRAGMLDLVEGEHRLLLIRSSATASINFWLVTTNLIGLALIVALAGLSAIALRRIAQREFAYMAELERSNQELDDFAYIASHDLKEPLRGLFNHASFLLEDYEDKIDADGVRRLTRLRDLCQRMERLINDLMYFSRLGRGDLAIQETDPNALLVEIQNMMETLLDEHHAQIVVPHALPRIRCDKTRVAELFRNLITNAIKYNDKSERLVEVGFLDKVQTRDGLNKDVFYVRDNGVGIEPEFHQEIFRIFKRLQNSSDGADNGTGVGLTFVKKIVERHGGRIWLESDIGKGTIFYFNLNRGRSEPARKAA